MKRLRLRIALFLSRKLPSLADAIAPGKPCVFYKDREGKDRICSIGREYSGCYGFFNADWLSKLRFGYTSEIENP